jgi:hypothetical protein
LSAAPKNVSPCRKRDAARERRIERLRKLTSGGPARLNPRLGRVLDRRWSLTVSLRRVLIVKRWEMLRRWRAGKASLMTPTPHLAAVERALVDAGGSVVTAARTPGTASANFRVLVRAQPLLAEVVFEQIEREIDAGQQVLWDGLDSDSAMTRMRAAA